MIILLERYQRRRTATLHQLLHLSTAQDCCSKIRSQALQARNATNGFHRNGPYR